MEVKLKLQGDKKLVKELEKLAKRYPWYAATALYWEGIDIIRDSIKRTPWEFSILRSSAYVAPPNPQDKSPRVEVGYGTSYAVYVHEDTSARHPRGGTAKFLERALDDAASGYLARLAQRIRKAAKQGAVLRKEAGINAKPRAPAYYDVQRETQENLRAIKGLKDRLGRSKDGMSSKEGRAELRQGIQKLKSRNKALRESIKPPKKGK